MVVPLQFSCKKTSNLNSHEHEKLTIKCIQEELGMTLGIHVLHKPLVKGQSDSYFGSILSSINPENTAKISKRRYITLETHQHDDCGLCLHIYM